MGRALIPLGLLLFVAGRCLVPMDETDLFFNLRLGEIILETGRVPRENLLSFTHPQAIDVNLAWLFQVVLALVHRLGGVPATVLLKTAFVLATCGLLYLVARRRGAHPALAAAALALAAWAAEPRFVERPHLVTFLGLGLLLYALERAEQGRPRLLWALVPGGLVWANGNSCFFLAPVLLALYALGAWRDGRRSLEPSEGSKPPAMGFAQRSCAAPYALLPAARRAGLVAALLAPLTFATPSGARWLGYVANHFRMPWLRPLQEYRAAEWPLDGPFFFLLAALTLVLAAGALRARSGDRAPLIPWRQLLPLVALALLGARRIRFVAEFALLAGPALAAAASRLLEPTTVMGGTRRWLAPAAAVGLLALTALPRLSAARATRPWLDLGIEPGLIPDSAISFVETHGLGERLYNDLEVGSYLTWRWWPKRRVFQDPRINGYPPEFHAVLRRPDLGRAEWQTLLDRHQVDAALITYPGLNPRAALFEPGQWALVYRAGDGLVFVRRAEKWSQLIAKNELPLTFSYGSSSGVVAQPVASAPAGSPLAACEWQRRTGDFWVESREDARARAAYLTALSPAGCLEPGAGEAARRALGAAALRLGDHAAALAALDGLEDVESRSHRGFALLGARRPDAALAAFDLVLGRASVHAEAMFGRALALEALGRSMEARTALRDFLARFPSHLAAPEAAARLARGAPR